MRVGAELAEAAGADIIDINMGCPAKKVTGGQAGCALIGGETAEMPGFYKEDEYDLAGFAVGVVDKGEIVDGAAITEGDVVLGLASSGLHSNGYSLARKVFFERAGLGPDTFVPELGCTLGEELLKPTKIYVRGIQALKREVRIKGMAHITGGGIPGNLPRILGDGIAAVIKRDSWPLPPVFALIRKIGSVPEEDMRRTFNLGIGYALVVSPQDADDAIASLRNEGLQAFPIGDIAKSGDGKIHYV
jgi:phosphoribosylformylglycinamidine cyclo-ligase